MKPQITNMIAWQQAEILMQPALIRLIDNIRKQLETSAWKGSYEEVQTPYPGYHLCLQYQDQQVRVNLWEICYQICFRNYIPAIEEEGIQEVEIDPSLINEMAEVDWQSLEDKTKQIVEHLFASLPGTDKYL